MKKFFLLLMMVTLGYSISFSSSNSHIILQHAGQITMFEPNQIANAMEQAADGDSILLSQGTFDSFTVTKSVTVRGDGDSNTHVKGITINGGDNVISPIIEGLHIGYIYDDGYANNNNIVVQGKTDNLKLKSCQCNELQINNSVQSSHSDMSVERCWIQYFSTRARLYSATFLNTYLYSLSYTSSNSDGESGKNLTFINCDTYDIGYAKNARSTFLNCRLNCSYKTGNTHFQQCTLINCILGIITTIDNDCYVENCWYESNGNSYKYTVEELTEKGYLGNDGTVVGIYGGASPYSTKLGLPRVSNSKITLDNENKILNVDVTFESN